MLRESVDVKKVTKRFEWTHTYKLRAYYKVGDIASSEAAFNAIVDAVLAEFTQNQVPGSARQTYPNVALIRTAVTVHTLAVNYAEILLDVPEIIDPNAEAGPVLAAIDVQYYKQPEHQTMTPPPDAEDIIEGLGGS
jgi:hypothetical protein